MAESGGPGPPRPRRVPPRAGHRAPGPPLPPTTATAAAAKDEPVGALP